FVVRIVSEPDAQVRGSDVWITAPVAASALARGGRVRVETLLGAKVLWISQRIAERRLVRLEGQGLPASQGRAAGSLYIRLAAETGLPESPARAQLRKFAAAWAA
ncbi:MAG: DnaJ C-terminal domain-containing protein, partial [Caulobacteraceae bacterium]